MSLWRPSECRAGEQLIESVVICMGLVIVILNYRTPATTADCLASLAPCLDEVTGGVRVMLVDNASGDDSVPYLREVIERLGMSEVVELLCSRTNLGFAGGNNLAIAQLREGDDLVLLLNSDTLVRPGTLWHCVKRMCEEPAIGVLSCRLDSPDRTPQANARRLPTPVRMTVHVLGLVHRWPRAFAWADLEDGGWDRRGESRDVEWVGGAFMLVRRGALHEVGPLDASFFFYGEDAELCHRVRRGGWRVIYDGRVGITHLGGGSSDPARLERRARDRLSWEARYLLQRRCFGRLAELYLRTLDLVVYTARAAKLRLSPSRRQDFETHRAIVSVLLTRPRAKGG